VDWKQFVLSGKGRVGRADFWTAWLFSTSLVWLLLQFGATGDVLAVAVGCVQIPILAKRLHDFEASGWLAAWVYGLFAAEFLWIGLHRGDAAANGHGPPAPPAFNLLGGEAP
jgi:uncharacterized membrane protein YhaH (DUF805 family)